MLNRDLQWLRHGEFAGEIVVPTIEAVQASELEDSTYP
jgi:hypothetical protein